MNNAERIQRRIERDKARRAAKKAAFMQPLDRYDSVFDFEELWIAGKRCCNGVRWKASIQRWEMSLLTNVAALYENLQTGKHQKYSGKFCCFDLVERGHLRHIRALKVNERAAQKALCDVALVPALERSFIYDNGATMKGKGITFAENRLTKQLRRFLFEMTPEKALQEGYVVQFDFHHYFDNADHETLFHIIGNLFSDRKLVYTIRKFIRDFGEKGLGLGSQISQILSLSLGGRLDHAIKDRMRMKFYGRYMDDGYIICRNKSEARKILAVIRQECDRARIEINEKKTRIVKLSRGFKFLQVIYNVTETGRIIRRTNHDGIKRMRNRLRAFRRKLDAGEIELENIEMSLEAWLAHCMRADTYRTRLSMWKRFRRMFPESKAFYTVKTNREEEIEKARIFTETWNEKHPNHHGFWQRIHRRAAWRKMKEMEGNHGVLQVSFRRCGG
jgi:hypothetical protein